MFPNFARSAIFVTAASGIIGMALCGTGQAESVKSQCSAKYQAAKTAGSLNGQTWNQFYSQCAASAKAETPPATPAAATPAAAAPALPNPFEPAAPAKPAKAATAPAAAPAAPAVPPPAATGPIVFPTAISPQYSTLSAGKARFKTCDDQYNANKATNSNGGLKWVQKGGGYYSECNKKLKS